MPHAGGRGIALTLAVLGSALSGPAWAQPAFDDFVDSEQYPIRMHWPADVDDETAQLALGFAEDAWRAQVVEMGFPAPTTVDDDGNLVPGVFVYLDPDGHYNMSEPVADNPDTSWTDCAVRMLIASVRDETSLEVTTWHEMSHAVEMAEDCGESAFAYEQTTVAATAMVYPDDDLLAYYFLPVFQDNPHLGLPCTFFADEQLVYFHFGGALFQIFLEERYGRWDGALLASIWRAARQDGTIESVGMYGPSMDVPNDPDLLDAIATALAPTTVEEAFVEFARWRAFVGARDDGAHFRDGALWEGSEVQIDRTLALADLPVAQYRPHDPPDELGSSYLDLSLTGLEPNRAVRYSFAGGAETRWHIDALLVRPDGTAEVREVPVAPDGTGALELVDLDTQGYDHVTFVADNLGTGTFDGNAPLCDAGSRFTYGLEVVERTAPLALTAVDPSELEVGGSYALTVTGEAFVDGAQASFSGDGITVDRVQVVDAATLAIDLAVREDASLGARDLTVTSPDGAAATLEAAVTLIARPPDGGADAGPEPPTGDESGGGCSCRAAPSSPKAGRDATAPLALVAALVGAVRRRLR